MSSETMVMSGNGAAEYGDYDDYEALPSSSLRAIVVAGSLAGVAEHCAMYPLDTVKTQMQSQLNPSREGVLQALRRIGGTGSYRGIFIVPVGAAPAHALYFSCYEKVKQLSARARMGSDIGAGVAGASATVVHDAVMNPVEVIKQRMQMRGSVYRTISECTSMIYRNEGLWAFYKSYPTQLLMNMPFQIVHVVAYERMMNYLNPQRDYDPLHHALAGGTAGAVAAALTTPLDNLKTVLNTQEECTLCRARPIDGAIDAAQFIYRSSGWSGYMRGITARVMFQMPGTAICWSVYEFTKFSIKMQNVNDENS